MHISPTTQLMHYGIWLPSTSHGKGGPQRGPTAQKQREQETGAGASVDVTACDLLARAEEAKQASAQRRSRRRSTHSSAEAWQKPQMLSQARCFAADDEQHFMDIGPGVVRSVRTSEGMKKSIQVMRKPANQVSRSQKQVGGRGMKK
jgi:hypothetical protein